MCEPATITMGVLLVAGAGTMMYGQHQAGEAADDAAEYTVKMREQEAESAAEKQSFEARERLREHQRQIAAGSVSAAGSGMQIDSGNMLDWEGDMVGALGLDLAAMEHNLSLTQYGLKSSAALSRAEGQNAKTASYYQMAGTALSTVGSIAGSWPTSGGGAAGGGNMTMKADAPASVRAKYGW